MSFALHSSVYTLVAKYENKHLIREGQKFTTRGETVKLTFIAPVQQASALANEHWNIRCGLAFASV